MEIVKTTAKLSANFKQRGRPNKYPFDKLNPGETLVIKNSTVSDLQRVKSAFYLYKKNNHLDWQTTVRFSENIIYVSRLK